MRDGEGEQRWQVTLERDWAGDRACTPVCLTLWMEGGNLRIEVDAPFFNDPAPPLAAGATDQLWNYEVVELFLANLEVDPPRYTEIELGPHGHHLVLCLEGVRCPVSAMHPIAWSASIAGDRWRGTAEIPVRWLPSTITHFNAYAIHGQGEERVYLAAFPVPGEAPDFHRLQHFAVWPPEAR